MNAIFVGSGSISRRHLRNWQALVPDARCILVARARPDDLDESIGYDSSLDQALELGGDCVFLSNPSVFHVASARAALEAGYHVFCEKPLSVDTEGINDLVTLAEEKNRVLFVGYNLRFHACLREISARIQRGDIGPLLTLFLEVGQALQDWRSHIDYRKTVSARKELGGGALLELSHDIDTAHWLSGAPLKSVIGKWGQSGELELDVEDYASLSLNFEGRATAHVHLDFLQRPGGRRYRLIGTKGTLAWSSAKPQIKFTRFSDGGVEEIKVPAASDPNHSYIAQLEAFILLVKKDIADVTHTVGAADVLKCLQSLRNNNSQ